MLFGVHIMPFGDFLFLMMVICAFSLYRAKRWLKDNPDVKKAANAAASSKAIDLIKRFLK